MNNKLRIRFEKTGRAVYVSHLDLMRTMQRAFLRAGFPLAYSEGFNPHAILSMALPLSVGTESVCELMDFRLREPADPAVLPEREAGDQTDAAPYFRRPHDGAVLLADVDAVAIFTQRWTHGQHALAALRAGQVVRGQRQPGQPGQPGRQEAQLQGLGDALLRPVQPGPVQRLPGLLPEDKCTPTKAYVMWGVGPSYHGTGSTGRVVTDLRNAGMKTVVIDPRLTPDAARADVWLPIRPGTDVALMLAWINYIIENELWDHDFCREWTNLPFLVHEDTRLTYRASELGLGTEDEYIVWDKKTNSAVAMPYPFPADGSIDPEMFGSYELPNGETARTAFQIMKEHVSEWTLEKAAEVCWLEADKIEEAIKIYVEGCPNAGRCYRPGHQLRAGRAG